MSRYRIARAKPWVRLGAAALIASFPGGVVRADEDGDEGESDGKIGMVCSPGDRRCPGQCLSAGASGDGSAATRVGYCTTACSDDRPCPKDWRCKRARGGRRVCAHGTVSLRDPVNRFHEAFPRSEFPDGRAALAERTHAWYLREKGARQADLMAQLFLLTGMVVLPSRKGMPYWTRNRDWELSFLEDLVFFARILPAQLFRNSFYRLERHADRSLAGRTLPDQAAVHMYDGNYGVYGTFLHEMGHVAAHTRFGDLDTNAAWRKMHGWRRDATSPTGWKKTGKDCTNGYGPVYGVPGQEFADEQWNYVRYGCSFRQCHRGYYEFLKKEVYRGYCYCSKDPTCRNANPFQ